MTIRDIVMIVVGEILLMATFAMGVAVGCSMRMRKEAQYDHDN
jgi:hypothetical protein